MVNSESGAIMASAMKGSKQSPLGAKGSGKSVKSEWLLPPPPAPKG